MRIALSIVFWVWFAGFAVITAINMAAGPVTLGLAVMRGALWPLWVATGQPHGQRAEIIGEDR